MHPTVTPVPLAPWAWPWELLQLGVIGKPQSQPAKGFSLKTLPSWVTSEVSFKVTMVQLAKQAAGVAVRTPFKREAFSPGLIRMAAAVIVTITVSLTRLAETPREVWPQAPHR